MYLPLNSMTVNCPPANANSTANCVWTSLYNNENTADSSIISSTLVTKSATSLESSFYPMIITAAVAAAAATPVNTLASPTTASAIPPKSTTTSSSTHHSSLSSGAKAGIGVGVTLGILALAGIALLLYSHNKHKRGSSQTENLMDFEAGGAGEPYERKEVGPPDTSGVYEMQGRRSPVPVGELESPVHVGETQG